MQRKVIEMAYEVPPLAYAYNALEPHIDDQTMHLHHDKHHAAYVTNLNAAVAKHPGLDAKSPEELIRNLSSLPEDVRGAIRNNGGGHVNHSMFWQIMGPKGGAPSGAIADAISKTFGGVDKFQEAFEKAGLGQFGSGWAWLVKTKTGAFEIKSTPNQDNPMSNGELAVRHGIVLVGRGQAPSRSSPRPTRTIPCRTASSPFWGTMFGSMPTTSS